MTYRVMVSGVCMYETDSDVIASATKLAYMRIGWTDVKIIEVEK